MIWCVEDDNDIRDIEIYTIVSTGLDARGFSNGSDMFNALSSETPDLIILDVMLPGQDGVEILKQLKTNAATADIPVIMATAKSTEYDKVKSLDIGADDYLVKPFGMMEMISRIKAVLRRCGSGCSTSGILCAKGIILNTDARTVTVDGQKSDLTFKEFEILKLLISSPSHVFTRDAIFSAVWGCNYVGETRTVDMHIQTLRKKMGKYANMIETVRNVGYRLDVTGN